MTQTSVLFTCIGRRVSLLRAFRWAAKALRIQAHFMGADTTALSPAWQVCDQAFLVKPVDHRTYVGQLLSIVADHRVQLLIPTVDLDLGILAENCRRFESLGCRVLVSSPDVIQACQDKRETYRFLVDHGFDAPLTVSPSRMLRKGRGRPAYPLVLKPWDGYASKGNVVVKDRRELAFFSRRVRRPICQEFVRGTEYTCDVYVDFHGQVRCVVPRMRIEVRSGEVSKALVVKDRAIMDVVADLVTQIHAGPGVIAVQVMVTPEGRFKFIEINPRFGGGAPLSIRAGADFPRWVLQEVMGKTPKIAFDGFQDGLIMLRYDDEVWAEGKATDLISTPPLHSGGLRSTDSK